MRSRLVLVPVLAALAVVLAAGPALACGGLVAPNGAVNLVRTTTLAAYHDGVEHYVTSFEFVGGGAKFGSIVPLPGVPTSVRRGGDWTLQRLVREVAPPIPEALFAGAALADGSRTAKVLLRTTVDALDITVLEGGGFAVGRWAERHGFRLSPDAPEVLDFYATRSPIFLAASFDPARAKSLDQNVGDGTPVHIAIPTPNPWVPLRILGLGATDRQPIQADVFLLTDRRPALLPKPLAAGRLGGMSLERSEEANGRLLADLRSDKGMEWLPSSGMWLSYLKIAAPPSTLTFDLAVDASGAGHPSPVAAGLPVRSASPLVRPGWWAWAGGAALLAGIGILAARRRPAVATPR